MAFDYKKEYKEFYMPKNKPGIVTVPGMNYLDDDEPAAVALMHEYTKSQGYVLDITDRRLHHEIYLSDARKVAPERLKTVIRHPIR